MTTRSACSAPGHRGNGYAVDDLAQLRGGGRRVATVAERSAHVCYGFDAAVRATAVAAHGLAIAAAAATGGLRLAIRRTASRDHRGACRRSRGGGRTWFAHGRCGGHPRHRRVTSQRYHG